MCKNDTSPELFPKNQAIMKIFSSDTAAFKLICTWKLTVAPAGLIKKQAFPFYVDYGNAGLAVRWNKQRKGRYYILLLTFIG